MIAKDNSITFIPDFMFAENSLNFNFVDRSVFREPNSVVP